MGPVALDSCVFIYHFERHPGLADRLETLFRRLDDRADPLHGVASVLVVLEVLVGPLRSGRGDLVEVYRRALTSGHPKLRILPIDAAIAASAAELRARHGALRTPDAIHLATAIAAGASCFVTADRRLVGRAPLRVESIAVWDPAGA